MNDQNKPYFPDMEGMDFGKMETGEISEEHRIKKLLDEHIDMMLKAFLAGDTIGLIESMEDLTATQASYIAVQLAMTLWSDPQYKQDAVTFLAQGLQLAVERESRG